MAWVRETWPDRPEFIAIDGKTSRRSHDRAEDLPPPHMVSAFATTRRLVLAQEAAREKSNELTAIPVLLRRLAVDGGIKGALVTIDAIARNATIARAILDAGADYPLETRTVTVARQVDWLQGDRRFPGELRMPGVKAIVKVEARAELKDRSRRETRCYICSRQMAAPEAGGGPCAVIGESRTRRTGNST